MQFWSNGADPQYLGQIASNFELKGLREFALNDENGRFFVPIQIMQCSIEDNIRGPSELMTYLRRHNVPAEAEQRAYPRTASTIYSWHVGSVDLDLYERIFDMEVFQPYDESRDPEYLHRLQEADRNKIWGADPLVYAPSSAIGAPYLGGAAVNSVLSGPITGMAASSVIVDELTSLSPSLPSFSPEMAERLRRAAVSREPEARPFNPWTGVKKLFF